MTDEQVFHAGERAVQLRASSEAHAQLAARGAKVIRDFMPEQHREFFSLLPLVVIGSVSADGQPWASVLANPSGFIAAPTPNLLTIAALPANDDPLATNLRRGAALGVLGIQPHTRRRNRANGSVESIDDSGFALRVRQSFGNCPKYIQAREAIFSAREATVAAAVHATELDEKAQRLIRNADTFFIASAHPAPSASQRARGVDVSHRGGKPGFVAVRDAHTLIAPDFIGNFYFNTLGNLALEPRAGLLFIDFERGDLLHVAVRVEIIWAGAELDNFAGAERLLRMQVLATNFRPAALPLRWGPAQQSPFLARTGVWS